MCVLVSSASSGLSWCLFCRNYSLNVFGLGRSYSSVHCSMYRRILHASLPLDVATSTIPIGSKDTGVIQLNWRSTRLRQVSMPINSSLQCTLLQKHKSSLFLQLGNFACSWNLFKSYFSPLRLRFSGAFPLTWCAIQIYLFTYLLKWRFCSLDWCWCWWPVKGVRCVKIPA